MCAPPDNVYGFEMAKAKLHMTPVPPGHPDSINPRDFKRLMRTTMPAPFKLYPDPPPPPPYPKWMVAWDYILYAFYRLTGGRNA